MSERVEIDPENFDLLKGLINETYIDGIDRIEGAWLAEDDRIEAIVWDEDRQLVVDASADEVNILQTNDEAYIPPSAVSFAGGKQRNCKTGTDSKVRKLNEQVLKLKPGKAVDSYNSMSPHLTRI